MKNSTKILATIILALNLGGCAKLWPYKSDFDCPVPRGERCKSLYDVNKMADQGKFSPKHLNKINSENKKSRCCKKCFK